jgi:hypothetical protein
MYFVFSDAFAASNSKSTMALAFQVYVSKNYNIVRKNNEKTSVSKRENLIIYIDIYIHIYM